jgi:predicted permease
LANRLALPLPKMVNDTLQLLGQTALPCALFVLGASLHYSAKTIGAGADTGYMTLTKKELPDTPTAPENNYLSALRVLRGKLFRGEMAEAAVLVVFKMFLHPFLVWLLAFHIFEVDPLWGAVAVMAAGMPIGINAFMFAQKYQECLQVVGRAILLSTLLAVLTESVLLAIFL